MSPTRSAAMTGRCGRFCRAFPSPRSLLHRKNFPARRRSAGLSYVRGSAEGSIGAQRLGAVPQTQGELRERASWRCCIADHAQSRDSLRPRDSRSGQGLRREVCGRSEPHATDRYLQMLGELGAEAQEGFSVPDLDLDTGYASRPGTYRLMDKTYATLLEHVTTQTAMPPLGCGRTSWRSTPNPDAPIETKKHPKKWAKVAAGTGYVLREHAGRRGFRMRSEARGMPVSMLPKVSSPRLHGRCVS